MKKFILFIVGLFYSWNSLMNANDKYIVTNVGTLAAEFSSASDINNNGQVCGCYSVPKQGSSTPETFAFFWDSKSGLRTIHIPWNALSNTTKFPINDGITKTLESEYIGTMRINDLGRGCCITPE